MTGPVGSTSTVGLALAGGGFQGSTYGIGAIRAFAARLDPPLLEIERLIGDR